MSLTEYGNALGERKGIIFKQLTKNYDSCKSLSKLVKVKVAQHLLAQLVHEWSDLKIEIVTHNSKINVAKDKVNTHDFDTIDELINGITEKCFEAEEALNSPEPAKVISSNNSRPFFTPKLDVPIFDGNISRWSDFKALFDNLVHNATHITAVEKLQYLRTRLSNEALSIVSQYALTDSNYLLAYEDLEKRYDNKRRLGSHLLQQILQYKAGKDVNLVSYLEKHRHATSELKSLNLNALDDFLLFELCYNNLPLSIQRLLDRELNTSSVPTLSELLDYVQVLARSDELRSDKKIIIEKPNHHPHAKTNKAFVGVTSTPKVLNKLCKLCKGEHKLQQCNQFLAMSIDKRINTAKTLGHCLNCLNWHHSPCKSSCQCLSCGSKRHHSLLHLPSGASSTSEDNSTKDDTHIATATVNSCVKNRHSKVLFGTVRCCVKDNFGQSHEIRAVLDSCSDITIVTSQLVKKLGLKTKRAPFDVQGITQTILKPKGCTQLELQSSINKETLVVDAVVLDQICNDLPSQPLSSNLISKFQQLELADPYFYQKASVDMLLGADIFQDCLSDELPSVLKGRPSALRTIFGWVIVGNTEPPHIESTEQHETTAPLVMFTKVESLDHQIARFWEQEHVEYTPASNPEDVLCETLFTSTHYRENGRYVVKIPFKSNCKPLGTNRYVAEKYLMSLERKFDAKPCIKTPYSEFLKDYLLMSHMEVAKSNVDYLLPHHAVYKASSTTSVRVVFDGSVKDNLGISLNDRQNAGPKLQANIDAIIVNFRFHQVALTADVKQMYRQILIHPDDRKVQHILWRENKTDDIQEFELKTITYGLSSSPYLAQRVLRQLEEDEGSNFPLAAHAIRKHCFMDDFCTGASSVSEAQDLAQQLTDLLHLGGFELRKWTCSHPALLSQFPENHLEKPITFNDGELGIKILGLLWEPSTDCFRFVVVPFNSEVVTKRTILSYIAKIHDITGLLNPIIFSAKYFMQLLWLAHVDWDEQLDLNLLRQWRKFTLHLPDIADIRIPRLISHGIYRLILFSDASEKGMASVAYVQVEQNGVIVDSRVLKAKSQVAPLQKQTINRLELGAALLSAKLSASILSTIDVPIESTHFFTDSKTVLLWLRKPSHMLKIYEANRTTQIHDLTTGCSWRHVSGELNPADLNSRGTSVEELKNSVLWWHGPEFLQSPPSCWKFKYDVEVEEAETVKAPSALLTTAPLRNDLLIAISKYSSFTKLIRVMAYVLRFYRNCRQQSLNRNLEHLTSMELDTSLHTCIRVVQENDFQLEIQQLKSNKPLPRDLLKLTPFIDKNLNVLRVGGRLVEASYLPNDTRHPFLLKKTSPISRLICVYYHKKMLHSGPKTTEAAVRSRFWILSLHSLVKSVLNSCKICYKLRQKPLQPVMANIPTSRLAGAFAFESCALDLAGPFLTKESNLRKSTQFKSYLCLFVCLKTTAVHLEMVTDLTTAALLLAYQRFCARRGTPLSLHSDCGTNLKGASRYLKECTEFLKANADTLCSAAAALGTIWYFNAPHAPNFNGMAEAGIKSAKNLLLRQAGHRVLTYEEFSTLLCRVEAVLNSRPLTSFSTDPNENLYLTPGHFTTGRLLMCPPEAVPVDNGATFNSRWKEVQTLSQMFWKTWSNHYLHQLMQREKWTIASSNITVGELVYVTGIQTSPLSWPLGKVEEVFPGKDGVVRVVKVRLGDRFLTRPVNKLVKIPVQLQL